MLSWTTRLTWSSIPESMLRADITCGAEFVRFNWPFATGSRRIESILLPIRCDTVKKLRARNLSSVGEEVCLLSIIDMVTRWGSICIISTDFFNSESMFRILQLLHLIFN